MPTSITAANAPYIDDRDPLPIALRTVSSSLDAALRLPRSSPLVASWLFPDDIETPFADASTLFPSSFDCALTTFSASTFTPFRHTSPSIAAAPPSSNSFAVFITLHVDDQVAFGFTFHIGLPAPDSLFPIADVLRSKFALVGRFALDRVKREVIFYIKDFSDNTSHLGLCERLPNKQRRLHFLSLPKRSFTSKDLPSEALGATVICQPAAPADPRQAMSAQSSGNNERKQSSSCSDWNADGRVKKEVVKAVQARAPCGGTDAKAYEVLTKTKTVGSLGPAGGGLDPVSLGYCIRDLRSVLCGEFRPCQITRNLPATPGVSCAEVVGLFSSMTRFGGDDETELLQRLAARTYYAAVLSVSNDMRLVGGGEGREEGKERKRKRKRKERGG